jgi:DNA polymerase-3 subunit delta'
MINSEIYPWNLELWEQFCTLRKAASLPHALLLTGPSGIGKKALAAAMAKSLLCESRAANGSACGHCVSCRWFEAGNHPDMRLIRPAIVAAREGNENELAESDESIKTTSAETRSGDKKLSKEITIAQVRALADFSALTASRAGIRIALIYPAEAMNVSAANALLKTLEEPSGQFHFFLVADAPHWLLPTLRSRCRIWPVPAPDRSTALQWLKQRKVSAAENKLAALSGAPLTTLEWEDTRYWKIQELLLNALSQPMQIDIPDLAKQLESAIKLNEKENPIGAGYALDLPLVLSWLQRWVLDIVFCHFGVPVRYYPGYKKGIERAKVSAEAGAWLRYWQWLNRVAQDASHPLNLPLFLEDCLLRYPGLNLAYQGD